MQSYRDYVESILPGYLDKPNPKKFLRAFSDLADEAVLNMQKIRAESMLLECSPDSLGLHFQNRNLIQVKTELPQQQVNYLSRAFTDIWGQSGTLPRLLDELKRIGFTKAKTWTWTDLINVGVPLAFGGNFTKVPGFSPGGDLFYLKKLAWTTVNISHVATLPNQPLQVFVNNLGPFIDITVQLKTDGTTFPISTAFEVFRELEKAGVDKYIYFGYGGTGGGLVNPLSPILLPIVFTSYFFIDIYENSKIGDPIYWNDNQIDAYTTTFGGPTFYGWKLLPAKPDNSNAFIINGFWGSSESNLWLTKVSTTFPNPQENKIFNYNGTTFTSIPMTFAADETVVRIHGTAPDNVWVLVQSQSGDSYFYWWNGISWQKINLPAVAGHKFVLLDMHVYNPTSVWCCGYDQVGMVVTGVIFKWNGTTFVAQAVSPTPEIFTGITVINPTLAWATARNGTESWVYKFDGTTFTKDASLIVMANKHFKRIWALDANHVFIGGGEGAPRAGRLWKHDGTSWSVETIPSTMLEITDIQGLSATDIWAVGISNERIHSDGTSWTSYQGPDDRDNRVPKYLTKATSIILYGSELLGVSAYKNYLDGNSYKKKHEQASKKNYSCIAGLSKTQIYMGGSHLVGGLLKPFAYFSDGTTVTEFALPISAMGESQINACFALDANNVWFGGTNGYTAKWDGTSFTEYSAGAFDVNAFKFLSASEGYAACSSGTILRWNGSTWNTYKSYTFPTSPAQPNLLSIDVFKTGANVLLCAGGEQWQVVFSFGAVNSFYQIPMPGMTDFISKVQFYPSYDSAVGFGYTKSFYAVGSQGHFHQFTYSSGTGMVTSQQITLPGTDDFLDLFALASNDIWVSSAVGDLYRFNGSGWVKITAPLGDGKIIKIYAPSYFASQYVDVWYSAEPTAGNSKLYNFSPDNTLYPAKASGKLWNDGWFWNGLLYDKNTLSELKTVIRKFKPAGLSCRFVRIRNAQGKFTGLAIGNEYEEKADGSIVGNYLSNYLTP